MDPEWEALEWVVLGWVVPEWEDPEWEDTDLTVPEAPGDRRRHPEVGVAAA